MKKSLSLLPLAWAALAQAAAPQPLGCLIEPHATSDVGSPVIGVIETLHAERGDRVRRGQALATLRSDVERASVEVAQSRAVASGEVRAAEANLELARQKLARAEDLARQQFISSQALEQARAEAQVAQQRLTQAREQRDIYAREHELTRAQLGLRTIRSPADGVVADRFLSVGERVEEKPVFRVAQVHPLRVEVVLPAALYGAVRPGAFMQVTPEFPGAAPRRARVTLVDGVIEGASNTFRARMELPNANHALPAGLRCKAELLDDRAAPAVASRRARPGEPASQDVRLRLSPALGGTTGSRP